MSYEELMRQFTDLQARNTALRRDIAAKDEALRKAKLRIDGLLWVWCSGGCTGGVLQKAEGEVTEEMVQEIELNTKRLRSWWNSYQNRVAKGWQPEKFKKQEPGIQSRKINMLSGRWRVNERGIFNGILRIGRFDFDTAPSDEFKQAVYEQMEDLLNAPLNEIQIDYSELEARTRVSIPEGVNWTAAAEQIPSYESLFDTPGSPSSNQPPSD